MERGHCARDPSPSLRRVQDDGFPSRTDCLLAGGAVLRVLGDGWAGGPLLAVFLQGRVFALRWRSQVLLHDVTIVTRPLPNSGKERGTRHEVKRKVGGLLMRFQIGYLAPILSAKNVEKDGAPYSLTEETYWAGTTLL